MKTMKTGIHIKPCKTSSAEAHNSRDKDYLERVDASGKKTYDIFRDETHLNRSWVNPDYQGRTLDQVLKDLRQEVKEKTGRAMQAKATPIREGVCPILLTTRISDFQGIVDWYARHGATVIRIDLHQDEGYQDDAGNRKHNRHAHIIVDYIDHSTGRSVKLTKDDISELQTVVANSLQMERGTPKKVTKKEHLDVAEYREMKANEHTRNALSLMQKMIEMLIELFDWLATLVEPKKEELEHRNYAATVAKRDIDKISDLPTFSEILWAIAEKLCDIIEAMYQRCADPRTKRAENGLFATIFKKTKELFKLNAKPQETPEKPQETLPDIDFRKLGWEAAEQAVRERERERQKMASATIRQAPTITTTPKKHKSPKR